MSDDTFKKGEAIMAKWSGSKKYFKGTVLKSTKSTVDVEFEDGTKSTIKKTDVEKYKESVSPKLSRARASSKKRETGTASRSRSRSKSAGRPRQTRSRSKSKTKSPARVASPKKRSPGRPKTQTTPALITPTTSAPKTSSPKRKRESSLSPVKKSTPKSPKPAAKARQSRISNLTSKSKSIVTSSVISSSSTVKLSGRISPQKIDAKLEQDALKVQLENVRPSLKEKMAQLEKEHSLKSEKIYVTRLRGTKERTQLLENKKAEESRLDEIDSIHIEKVKPVTKVGVSFLESLGSLVVLFGFPALVIFLILGCARNQGKLLAMPYLSKNWRFYITPLPTAVFFGFVVLQGLLQLLPVGPIIEGFVQASKVPRRNLLYRKNGLIALLITVALIPIAIYFNKLPTEFIRAHFLHLATASILFSVIFSVALYFKSFYAPPHDVNAFGNSKFFYHNLVIGRQLNPRIGQHLDLKFLVFRIGLIAWAVIDLLFLYKVYTVNHSVHCTLTMTVAMQLLYIVDIFLREEQLLATASVMYESVGFQRIFGICTMNPFTSTLPVLYLVDRKTELPYYCLSGITLLYLVGLYLSRKSNSLKYIVKRNPHTPGIETISFGKNNLIRSGPWRIVRHPNYLGDILIFLAWTLPCEFSAGIPYVPVGTISLLLLWRIFQVEKRMEVTHGSGYTQYKHSVPKRILPYIF